MFLKKIRNFYVKTSQNDPALHMKMPASGIERPFAHPQKYEKPEDMTEGTSSTDFFIQKQLIMFPVLGIFYTEKSAPFLSIPQHAHHAVIFFPVKLPAALGQLCKAPLQLIFHKIPALGDIHAPDFICQIQQGRQAVKV